MNRNEELQDQLRRLARAVPQEASSSVERELRLRFRARSKQGRWMWRRRVGLAAALLLAGALFWAWTRSNGVPPSAAKAHTPREELAPGFIALPYSQSGVPVEQGVIVRLRISVSELGVMGVPLAGVPSSGKVRADVLVGQDGIARAVRIVD